jgi:hypothetical protein
LYAVAPSKEQLITAVVRAFFRRSTKRIEQRLGAEPAAARRIGAYLEVIAAELAPASPAYLITASVTGASSSTTAS